MRSSTIIDHEIEVVAYNPAWPNVFASERDRILALVGASFVDLEHIGSTAIPNLAAKPIIDMMAAVLKLEDAPIGILQTIGYEMIQTGMRNRIFLRNYPQNQQKFHLHIVEQQTWATRKERLMRDYLCKNPEATAAYGKLKERLVTHYQHDSQGYTQAKTSFIQDIINRARNERGLPEIDVWNDE